MEIVRFITHYGMHFILPGIVAYFFFRKKWKTAWLIMIITMLIDLDHLFATPVFDPNRCSISFHPLHTYYALAGYIVLYIIKSTRAVGLGLLLHFATDWVDCWWL